MLKLIRVFSEGLQWLLEVREELQGKRALA
jgi:hypothetical protein